MPDLILVHAQEVIRLGLKDFLSGTNDLRVVAECSTIQDAEAAIAANPEALLVSDTLLGDAEAYHLFSLAKRSVAISHQGNPTHVARAIAAGAQDYLPSELDQHAMRTRISAAAMGKPAPAPRSQFVTVREQMSARKAIPQAPFAELTPRECQTLRCLSYGLANAEIAKFCEISVETVKEHVQHLLRKLGVNDRTQAAVMYVRMVELKQ